MFDHHCPQCRGSIRGKTLLSAKTGRKLGLSQSNAIQCPYCGAILLLHVNIWQFVGNIIVAFALLARLLVDDTAHPTLFFSLGCLIFSGFLLAAISVIAFPRFRLFRPPHHAPLA